MPNRHFLLFQRSFNVNLCVDGMSVFLVRSFAHLGNAVERTQACRSGLLLYQHTLLNAALYKLPLVKPCLTKQSCTWIRDTSLQRASKESPYPSNAFDPCTDKLGFYFASAELSKEQ
jgi:hypothetical protein